MSQINDFCNDLGNILKRKHVRDMLTALTMHESGGWEKWFQFELIRYYHDNGHEPYWECGYEKNLQHKPDKITNRIDLVYRKKNRNNDYYNGVEIKVMRCPQYSIKGILKDLSGISQIKASNWELRAVTGLAVYSSEVMEGTKEYSKYKNFVHGLVSARRAKLFQCNGWTCMVLGWSSRTLNTPNAMKQDYKDYLESIRLFSSKYEIAWC